MQTRYMCAVTMDDVRAYLAGSNIVAFDFETAPDDSFRAEPKAALDPHKAHIAGVSFSVAEGSAIYVPVAHKTGTNIASADALWQWLKEHLFENKCIVKVAHNLSFEAMFLYAKGTVVKAPCYDTIAAAQMTLKSRWEFRTLYDSGLKYLSTTLFAADMPSFETVTAGRHFDEMNPQAPETLRYACADSDYTLRLYHKINNWFDRFLPRHRVIVENLESPTAVYCGMMKYNGVPVDKAQMLERQKDAEEKIRATKAEIDRITGGVAIGANASTAAFKQYLFHDLRLPVMKKTDKDREAVDDAAMQMLKEWCADNRPELVRLFELVQEYRKWGKLKSTYIDGYLTHINAATGRIHPDFLPLGTETGRFASRNPNLQNCFDSETEILTMRGFVRFSCLTEEDEVAQWSDGEISFVKPDEIICQDYKGELVHVFNQHIDLMMTPSHRCLLKNRKTGEYVVFAAMDYPEDYMQLHGGRYTFGKGHLSNEMVTLLCATQADAHWHDRGYEFLFSRARKYRRLKMALDVLGADYSESVKPSTGQVRLRIRTSDPLNAKLRSMLGPDKKWGSWVLGFDLETITAIQNELRHWDGCFTRDSMYSSSIKDNADWMQILYTLTGTRAKVREYWNGNPNAKINYQLDVTKRNYSMTTNVHKETVPYEGKVYCVSVPSGFIVTRRKGRTAVTGNCPRKTNDPVGIRNFIVASPGNVLMSLDFSQIELRVGAFYCRDPKMLETYRSGGDIHAQTTSVIFGVPFDVAVDKNAPDYKEHRTIAKNCNFGVFYGLFPKGLQTTLRFKAGLDTPLDRCREIINNLKAGYKGLTVWQENTKRTAQETCYAETWLGRRRYLIGMLSEDWGKRSFAERCALNTPIQGTAADILKAACGRIVEGISARMWLWPLLQIHDELVFELPAERLDEAVHFVKTCMEQQPYPEFDVPIVAEASVGQRFGAMQELED